MSDSGEREARALVLRRVDYGEADLVVTLLTDAYGKRTAFAKSARKSRKRYGGGLEPLALLTVHYTERHDGGLARLLAADVEESFGSLSGDLHRLCWASLALEWTDELSVEGERSSVFDTTVEMLRWLVRESRGAWFVEAGCLRYGLVVLAHAGVLPEIGGCVRTGQPAEELDPVFYSPSAGGVLAAAAVRPEDHARIVARGAVDILATLLAGRFPTGEVEMLRGAREMVLDAYRQLIGKELRALSLLERVWL